ncbi:MAG: ComF family protein [Thiomargarita sp.]|nr:ComF family protein [Thiomargarita sp.]
MEQVDICHQCREEPPPYTHTQAVFEYIYPVNILIVEAKFNQNLAVLNFLGDLMGQLITIEPRPDVLIPVPLHPKRLRQRGYNQSLELAKCITKQTGIPLDYKSAQRIKNTQPQTSLANSQQRQENLKGAFQVTRNQNWQHIVLIDDVMTTGSTVKELALVFKKIGVKRVDVWCCVRR